MDILEFGDGNNDLIRSGIALGRITNVDPEKRFCSVKTFFGDGALADKNIPNCQWLSLDTNPAGDETTSIPREGSMGLVFFVGGEAFIWGYLKATTRDKGARSGKEPTGLNEGDKCIATVGGNRIVVKANGSIEIFTKETLKTVFFPKGGIHSDICEEYQLRCDGGNERWWTSDDVANFTLYNREFRKDLARTSILFEEVGYVDATTIKRTTIGPGLPGTIGVPTPVFESTIDILGRVDTKVGIGGIIKYFLTPTGEADLRNNFGGVNLSETGDWTFNTPTVKIEVTADGDTNIKGPICEAHLLKDGSFEIKNAVTSITSSAQGDIEVKNGVADIKVSSAGDYELSNGVCKLIMKTTGDLEFSNAVGKLKIGPDGKVGLGSAAAELLDILDQFLDAFINQTNLCMTPTGPSSGLLPPAMVTLNLLKNLLALIKGSV